MFECACCIRDWSRRGYGLLVSAMCSRINVCECVYVSAEVVLFSYKVLTDMFMENVMLMTHKIRIWECQTKMKHKNVHPLIS